MMERERRVELRGKDYGRWVDPDRVVIYMYFLHATTVFVPREQVEAPQRSGLFVLLQNEALHPEGVKVELEQFRSSHRGNVLRAAICFWSCPFD